MKKVWLFRKAFWMIYLLIPVFIVSGQNPVITHMFTSDPAALVYGDSVYLFTGHDEASPSATGFYMRDWHVFSSADMVNWKDHGPVLALSDFTWAVANAWAGQCIERDGKFYWYVPMSHNATHPGFSIGVAVADSPLGPYTDALGKALITNEMTLDITTMDWNDIDPSVFIDDDGQAYLFWGNTSCKYVKLKDNMIELDGAIQYLSLPGFTEGPWIYKHNDLYYLAYAANYPEEIHYAMSDKVTGPWQYKGMINRTVENSPTNHTAIIEFKNQSYFIYHTAALPTGGEFRRSVAIDYLFYNPDNTIMEVVQTAYGVAHADSTNSCPPDPITPGVRINDNDWTADRKPILYENDTLILSPEASEGGTWFWEGPDDFTDSVREITLNKLHPGQSGIYMVVFTNHCRTKSYMRYDLFINPVAPESIIPGTNYVIRPKNSEMVLTVQDASAENGAPVIQSAFNNTASQQWNLSRKTSDLYWKICPVHILLKRMEVKDNSLSDGAAVQIYDNWGYLNQQWQIIEQEPGIYKFIARHSGKCLDMEGTVTTEGAVARQWTCNDIERQQFTLTIAEDPVPVIESARHGEKVKIYPNPSVSGKITVDISLLDNPRELTIADMNGRIIYRNTLLKSRIIKPDLNLVPGIYLLYVRCDRSIYNIKFVLDKISGFIARPECFFCYVFIPFREEHLPSC
jgi:arabinoxylan arabinofuranohydrolase